jgi:hypothetical protein
MQTEEFQALARALSVDRAMTEGIRPEYIPAIARLHTRLFVDYGERVTTPVVWPFEYSPPAVVQPGHHMLFQGRTQAMVDVHEVRVVGSDGQSTVETLCVEGIRTDGRIYPVPVAVPVLPIGPTDLSARAGERVEVEVVNRGREPVEARVSVRGKLETGPVFHMWCQAVLPKVRRYKLAAGENTVITAMPPGMYFLKRMTMKSDSEMDVVVREVRCGNRIQMPLGDAALPVELFADGYEFRMDAMSPGSAMTILFLNQNERQDRYVEIEVTGQALGESSVPPVSDVE